MLYLRIPKFLLSTLVILLALGSLQPIAVRAEEEYRIGPDDVLEISVWQSPDLTKSVAVDKDGNISYPFLGTLPVSEMTVTQVEGILKEKLAQGYVKDPQVSVSVKEYNSKKILVFGEVAQPGLYKLKGNIPVLEMLFLVNGVKQDAKRMTIIRQLSGEPRAKSAQSKEDPAENAKAIEVNLTALLAQGDLSQNVQILPGDTIYVSSGTGQKYYVLGQVRKPGPYEWVQDVTVLEAIKLADGGTEKAALNRIKVRKNRGGQEETFKVNVVDIMRGKKKDDVIIKPGDVIIVPESWI